MSTKCFIGLFICYGEPQKLLDIPTFFFNNNLTWSSITHFWDNFASLKCSSWECWYFSQACVLPGQQHEHHSMPGPAPGESARPGAVVSGRASSGPGCWGLAPGEGGGTWACCWLWTPFHDCGDYQVSRSQWHSPGWVISGFIRNMWHMDQYRTHGGIAILRRSNWVNECLANFHSIRSILVRTCLSVSKIIVGIPVST